MISYNLKDKIKTDFSGYSKIIDFYNFAKNYKDEIIEIKFDELNWIDANLSALFLATVHKLKTENKLKFYIDFKTINSGLNVLFRNGLVNSIVGNKNKYYSDDYRKSTIPLKAFKLNDDGVTSFVNYIENDLLNHRGLESVDFAIKQKIKDSYFEIYDNVGIHAETNSPIIACGQYYPEQKEVKFTLVDFGVGFLKKIKEFTKGAVSQPHEAIKWAIDGNSTKKEARGGTGLKKIFFYCLKNNGGVHIISDNCYWEFENNKISNFTIKQGFAGTTINLIFKLR